MKQRSSLARMWSALAVLALVLTLSGCAPGNDRFFDSPAGFWAGLWHGAIALVTFVISLFTDDVRMYEARNVGEWYDGGFLLGVLLVWGGIFHSGRAGRKRRPCGREWEDIGERIEESIRSGFRDWASERDRSDTEWQEIARKIEEKIKRELRTWSER